VTAIIRPRVGISGSYGGINLGDEAILQVITNELRRSAPVELTVFTRDAADTLRRHRVERAVEPRKLSHGEASSLVRELDLFILGGGGILYDGDVDTYLREVTLSVENRTPVMVYAVGAGPLVEPRSRARLREALDNAAVVTVRDRQARQLLEEIGVRRDITVTADPALLLEPEPLTLDEILRSEAIDPDARLIAFSIREPGPAAPHLDVDRYHGLIANVADFVVSRLDAEAVFLPFERRNVDVQHSHAVVARMHNAPRATVLKRDYTPGQILSLLGRFEFCIGMRLHFLIFAALAGVPFVALPYASKVTGLLDELELSGPSLENVSAGELIAHVDRVWDMREDRRARLRRAVPELQARARVNSELTQGLLTDVVEKRRGRP
jgi:polysaccharide pyruvyl transferase CsaB